MGSWFSGINSSYQKGRKPKSKGLTDERWAKSIRFQPTWQNKNENKTFGQETQRKYVSSDFSIAQVTVHSQKVQHNVTQHQQRHMIKSLYSHALIIRESTWLPLTIMCMFAWKTTRLEFYASWSAKALMTSKSHSRSTGSAHVGIKEVELVDKSTISLILLPLCNWMPDDLVYNCILNLVCCIAILDPDPAPKHAISYFPSLNIIRHTICEYDVKGLSQKHIVLGPSFHFLFHCFPWRWLLVPIVMSY